MRKYELELHPVSIAANFRKPSGSHWKKKVMIRVTNNLVELVGGFIVVRQAAPPVDYTRSRIEVILKKMSIMKIKLIARVSQAAVIMPLLLVSACVSGLNGIQSQELKAYEVRGLKVMENDETVAAWLGLLPGGGSFYTGNPGYGIINLLFWPLSIAWDPISGINGAQSNNYAITKEHVRRLQNDELDTLLLELRDKTVDTAEYRMRKEAILRKYKVP
jgi:hypothetical protein